MQVFARMPSELLGTMCIDDHVHRRAAVRRRMSLYEMVGFRIWHRRMWDTLTEVRRVRVLAYYHAPIARLYRSKERAEPIPVWASRHSIGDGRLDAECA